MELFLNVESRALTSFKVLQLVDIQRAPLSGMNLNRNCNKQTGIQSKKLGFIPFKAPELEQPHTVQDPRNMEESDCLSSQLGSCNDEESLEMLDKGKKRSYRRYSLEEKINAISIINAGKDLKSVAKLFNIPRRNLLRWRKNGCQRKEGGGRPTDFMMEDTICQMLKEGSISTQKQIREQAKRLSSMRNFKASKGWFVKFCRRYQVSLNEIRILDQQNQ